MQAEVAAQLLEHQPGAQAHPAVLLEVEAAERRLPQGRAQALERVRVGLPDLEGRFEAVAQGLGIADVAGFCGGRSQRA